MAANTLSDARCGTKWTRRVREHTFVLGVVHGDSAGSLVHAARVYSRGIAIGRFGQLLMTRKRQSGDRPTSIGRSVGDGQPASPSRCSVGRMLSSSHCATDGSAPRCEVWRREAIGDLHRQASSRERFVHDAHTRRDRPRERHELASRRTSRTVSPGLGGAPGGPLKALSARCRL